MRKPGRPSAADLAARSIGPGSPPPLQPRPELTESEARSFVEIISTTRAGHFQQCDVRLLGLYCQALTLARRTGESRSFVSTSPPLRLCRVQHEGLHRADKLTRNFFDAT
jgi:hypothetical protein